MTNLWRKNLIAKAIATAEWFEPELVSNELSDMSTAQLDNLEDKYDAQIAMLLSMSTQENLRIAVDGA